MSSVVRVMSLLGVFQYPDMSVVFCIGVWCCGVGFVDCIQLASVITIEVKFAIYWGSSFL